MAVGRIDRCAAPPAYHRCAVGLLHSELPRRAASRRALPRTSSFCLWTKVHHVAWKSLVRILSQAPKLSGLSVVGQWTKICYCLSDKLHVMCRKDRVAW